MTTPAQIELLARALAGSYSRGVGMDEHDATERATTILAQLGPLDPLGAVVMREKAVVAIESDGEYVKAIGLANRIRAIPLPTHADRLAAALALPEIARLVKVAKWAQGCVPFPSNCHSEIVAALAALTPTATGETKGDA